MQRVMFGPLFLRHGGGRRWSVLSVLLVALLGIGADQGLAQQQGGTITGRVIGPNAQPISNAQVQVVGTQRGTITDARGMFQLVNVPAGPRQVRVSSVGFRSVTEDVQVVAGETAQIDVTLAVSAVALDEVVVTGQAMGSARRAIGTAVASIDATALETAPVTNLSQLLQARAPGVHVLPGGGKSGQGSRIVLRGAASVSQANEPLIYVDGVRIENASSLGIETTTAGSSWSGLDDINPADIERIEIVRGASAATLYGTEAAAGVIQIFTRRGSEGPARWTYSGEYGVLDTPQDWWDVSVYSPWFYDNMVQRGNTQTHQLSVSGGGQGFDYYVGGNIRMEDGILPNSAEDAYSFRLNSSLAARDDLTLRLSSSFTRRSVQAVPDANNTRGYTINGLVGGPRGQFVETLSLPAIQAFQDGNRYTTGITAEHRPWEFLTHRLTLGADVQNQDQHQTFPFGAISNLPEGFRSNFRRESRNLSFDYIATGRFDLLPTLQSTTSAGFQYFDRNVGSSSAIGNDFPFFGLETVGSTLRTTGTESRLRERMAGFFVEQQLGYRNLLFVTAGARADGHSAFGADVDYQIYPKVDVSYVVSEHLGFPAPFGTVRLRGAYGAAGQQPTNFAAVRTWDAQPAVGGQPAVVPLNIGNPDLKPEVTHERELGIDLGLLDDRVTVEVTRYDQTTRDALYQVRYPPSLGFILTQLENVGEIENNGWEIGARATVLETRGFRWDANANVSTNQNQIISLGGGSPIQLQWLQWMREGYPVGAFFGDRPIVHNGEVGMASELLRDADGTLPEGWDYIGPPLPTRTVQLGSNLSIGPRATVNFLFDHRAGAFAQSSTMRWLMQPSTNVTEAHLDAHANLGFPGLTTPGAVANICREAIAATNPTLEQQKLTYVNAAGTPMGTCVRASALTHGDFALPTDFWKLREVSVSYRLPEAIPGRLGMGSATITLAGRNLWRSTDYPGLEPESMYRNDLADSALRNQIFFDTPIPRQITVGVTAQF